MPLFGLPSFERLKEKWIVKGSIRALGYQQDWGVRRRAAEKLGRIGDSQAVEPLIAALDDEEQLVRQAAAEALGRIGDPSAVGPLVAQLKDKNGSMRNAVAQALGQIGDPRAVEPLTGALQSGNKAMRGVVAKVLVNLYSSGELDEHHKALILRAGGTVTLKHQDRVGSHSDRPAPTQVTLGGVVQSSDCHIDGGSHTDVQVPSIEFPV